MSSRTKILERCDVGDLTSELSKDLAEAFDKHTNKIVDAIKSLKEPTPELPDYVETNLNLYIKVKLTEYGKQIHREYWEPVCNDIKLAYEEPEVDSDGYSSFQMHDFMSVFGKHMTMTAPLVCETDVLIQRSK